MRWSTEHLACVEIDDNGNLQVVPRTSRRYQTLGIGDRQAEEIRIKKRNHTWDNPKLEEENEK